MGVFAPNVSFFGTDQLSTSLPQCGTARFLRAQSKGARFLTGSNDVYRDVVVIIILPRKGWRNVLSEIWTWIIQIHLESVDVALNTQKFKLRWNAVRWPNSVNTTVPSNDAARVS